MVLYNYFLRSFLMLASAKYVLIRMNLVCLYVFYNRKWKISYWRFVTNAEGLYNACSGLWYHVYMHIDGIEMKNICVFTSIQSLIPWSVPRVVSVPRIVHTSWRLNKICWQKQDMMIYDFYDTTVHLFMLHLSPLG